MYPTPAYRWVVLPREAVGPWPALEAVPLAMWVGCQRDCAEPAAPCRQGRRTDVRFSAPQQLCDLRCGEYQGRALGQRAAGPLGTAGGQGLEPRLCAEPAPGICLPLSRRMWQALHKRLGLVGGRGAGCPLGQAGL